MINFILGEDKHVKFAVQSRKKEAFSVNSATFELYYDGKIETSGRCDISRDDIGVYLDIKLSPQLRSDKYQLIVTYTIADEIKKHTEQMEVR